MGVKVENNAVAALTIAINDVDTTIQVGPQGSFFPDVTGAEDYFYGTLCNDPILTSQLPEIVKVTNIVPNASNYDLTVERLGIVGGSPSGSWNIGADLELRVTKQLLEDLVTGGVSQYPGLLGSSKVLTATGPVDNDDSGQIVICDTTLGSVTVNLEAIPATFGRDLRFWVVKDTADANTVVIAADAADNIEGSATLTLTRQNEMAIIHAIPGTNLWRAFVMDLYDEAPVDGSAYGRVNAAWAAVTEEAPSDGTDYVRKDGAWAAANYGAGSSSLPAGALLPYAAAAAPSGFLLCNGQTVSRTTYADLFAAIGTVYGTGDGATTFGLPDLRGRVPVGDDTMSRAVAGRVTSNNTMGQAAGAESHTLSTAEMPSHTHSINSGGSHSHSYVDAKANKSGTAASASGSVDGVSTSTDSKTTGTAGSHTHSMGSAGSGTAHNNMQPYQVFSYIIKT